MRRNKHALFTPRPRPDAARSDAVATAWLLLLLPLHVENVHHIINNMAHAVRVRTVTPS